MIALHYAALELGYSNSLWRPNMVASSNRGNEITLLDNDDDVMVDSQLEILQNSEPVIPNTCKKLWL